MERATTGAAVLVWISVLALGCGDDGTGSGGTGGSAGTGGSSSIGGSGGTGGTASVPQSVDQTCRDWCANEPEGASCHLGPFESIKPCYEGCLFEYQRQEADGGCGDEWIAIMDCQLELACEDPFGDCDPAAEDLSQCHRLAANRSYCEANCPDLEIETCQDDTSECQAIVYCDSTCPSLALEVCLQDPIECGRIGRNRTYCQTNCPSFDLATCEQDPSECQQLVANRTYCIEHCPSLDISACEQDTSECEQLVAAASYCELNCPLQLRQDCIDQYLSTGDCDSSGSDGVYGFTCTLSGLPIPMPVTIRIDADDPGFVKGQASSLTTLLHYAVAPAVVDLFPSLAPDSMFDAVEVTVMVTGGTPTEIAHSAAGLPFAPVGMFDSDEVMTVVTAGVSASEIGLSVTATRFVINGLPAALVPSGQIELLAGQGDCDPLQAVSGPLTFAVQ